MPQQRCKRYKPRKPEYKENCGNCLLWVGIQCKDHLLLPGDYEASRKFTQLDKEMRDNRGVFLP